MMSGGDEFAALEHELQLIPKQVHTSLLAAESICRSFHTDTSQLAAG